MEEDKTQRRDPVTYRYDGLNWDFIKMMAEIAHYAGEKYGKGYPDGLSNYMDARLKGEKSPLNHIIEHYRSYHDNEPYDHFNQDPIWHLVGIAYNAMMEAFYLRKFGREVTRLNLSDQKVGKYFPGQAIPVPSPIKNCIVVSSVKDAVPEKEYRTFRGFREQG